MKNTRQKIIDLAMTFTQTKGFNGWSYDHIAKELGIQKASIHYHFSSKSDLGEEIVKQNIAMLKNFLGHLSQSGEDPKQKLKKFSTLFDKVEAQKDAFCLCGMLTAEFNTLTFPIQKQLSIFFSTMLKWLIEEGSLNEAEAFEYLSKKEGALLLRRALPSFSVKED